MKKDVVSPDDTRKVCEVLLKIMSSQTCLGLDCNGSSNRSNARLLEEIDLFCKSLMEVDDGLGEFS